MRHSILVGICLVGCGAGDESRGAAVAVTAPAQVLPSAAPSAAPSDATCGGRLGKETPDAPRTTRSDPGLPLVGLVADAPTLRVSKSGPVIEVGTVRVRIRAPHPRGILDVGGLALPRDLARARASRKRAVAHWDG